MKTAAARSAAWVWLFPATYVVHILEELLAGEGFPAWASRLAGLDLTFPRFLAVNGVALLAMVVACGLAARHERSRWVVATLGTIVVMNGSLHAAASALTRSYSPGAVSGFLLWAPLGVVALHRARRGLRRRVFWAAVVAGILVHGLVTLVAALASRPR